MAPLDNMTEKKFKNKIREQAAEAVVRAMNGVSGVNFEKFDQNKEFQEELNANFDTWALLDELKDDPDLARMAEAGSPSTSLRKPFNKIKYAIAAAVPLFAVLIAYVGLNTSGKIQKEYFTEIWEQKTIDVEDSVITLNTQSKILVSFTNHVRSVELVYGEAFFNVSKDPARPFYVYNGNNKVTVVGTTFNVKVDRSNMTVAVVEGKVTVEETTANGDSMPTLLDAGKVANSDGDASTVIVVKKTDNIESYVHWRTGTLKFKNATLKEVVEETQRYTKKTIKLSSKIAELEITTVLRIESLEDEFAAMTQVLPIKVKSDGQTIYIDPAE